MVDISSDFSTGGIKATIVAILLYHIAHGVFMLLNLFNPIKNVTFKPGFSISKIEYILKGQEYQKMEKSLQQLGWNDIALNASNIPQLGAKDKDKVENPVKENNKNQENISSDSKTNEIANPNQIKIETDQDYDARNEITKEFTQFIITHYQRNMFWMIVAGFASIISSGHAACVVFMYLILCCKGFEIAGLFLYNYLFIYIGHCLSYLLSFISLCIAASKINWLL